MKSISRKYYFYVFDFSKQKDHIGALPFSVVSEFFETGAVTELDYTAFASVLMIILV